MDVRVEHKDGFKVAGLMIAATPKSDFAGLWGMLFDKIPYQQLESLGSGQSFGVCSDMKEDGSFRYMAGYHTQDVEKARALGLELMDVPGADYAVVPVKGPTPQCIKQGWIYVWDTFFPQKGYRHAGTPDFEVYAPGDTTCPDYEMTLWVPVKIA